MDNRLDKYCSNANCKYMKLITTVVVKRIFFKLCVYVCLYVFMCLWLHWVFTAACGLSLVAVSRGYSLWQ